VNLVIVASFAGVIFLSFALSPDPSGLGTHTQLGLPPCGLYEHFGIPCLSCGMTTAFAHMVRLHWIAGFHANPLGAGLFLLFGMTAVLNLLALVSGWSFLRLLERKDWTRFALLFLFLAVGSWGYKILWIVLEQP
jgi:hypothetical protein